MKTKSRFFILPVLALLGILALSSFFKSPNAELKASPEPDSYDVQYHSTSKKELHKVPIEEEPLINFLADSCKTLHIEVLNKINGNEDQKAKFDEAYQYCQQE